MKLEDRKKKLESYIKSLEDAIHHFDPQIAELKATIQDIRTNEKEAFSDETLKQLEQLGALPSESNPDQVFEILEAMLFFVSMPLPLLAIFNVFEYKGKWSFSDNYNIQFNFDEHAYSAREIYHLIAQLPEGVVLNKLKDVSIKSDTDLIIDAYKRKDENAFVQAFELVQDKQSIKDYFVFIAQAFDQANNYDDFNLNPDSPDKEQISDLKILMQSRDDFIRKSNDTNIVKATDYRSLIIQDAYIPWDINHALRLYQVLLVQYLEMAPKLDTITKEYVNKVIQKPDYIDITNELLAEGERMIKERTANNDGDGKKEEAKIIPLPFTTSISIGTNYRVMFLTELYNKLKEGRYVDSDKCEDFVYLLGGGSERPKNLTPINWLKQKNQLQAFCSVYLNKNTNIEWGMLNSYFTWRGDSPKLSNSCGVIPEEYKRNFLNLFNECTKTIPK